MIFLPSNSQKLFLALLHLQWTFKKQIFQIPDLLTQHRVLWPHNEGSLIVILQVKNFPVKVIDQHSILLLLMIVVDMVDLNLFFKIGDDSLKSCNAFLSRLAE